MMNETAPTAQPRSGLATFLWVGAGLALLRMALYFVQFQNPKVAYILSLFVSAIFLAVPIFALFRAASDNWTPGKAALMLVSGIALHAGGMALANLVFKQGFPGIVCGAVAQFGLMVWCVGLGGLLACIIRDKNLILPIAIFLAGFDVFLIFAPVTPTKKIIDVMPQFFENVTYVVPTFGAEELARIGPADFFILAMLFVVLFKFKMQTSTTLRWIMPVLVGYLFVVLIFGEVTIGRFSLGMLPALLPIGLTVLIINRKEFALNKEERLSTWAVAVLAVGMAITAFLLPTPKPEPSRPAPAPGAQSPADLNAPASPNPPQ